MQEQLLWRTRELGEMTSWHAPYFFESPQIRLLAGILDEPYSTTELAERGERLPRCHALYPMRLASFLRRWVRCRANGPTIKCKRMIGDHLPSTVELRQRLIYCGHQVSWRIGRLSICMVFIWPSIPSGALRPSNTIFVGIEEGA